MINNFQGQVTGSNSIYLDGVNSQNMLPGLESLGAVDSLDNLGKDGFQTQDSFGRLVNDIIADSPGSVDDYTLKSSIPMVHQSFTSPTTNNRQEFIAGQIFNVTDISPSWAFSSEETKVPYLISFISNICCFLLGTVFNDVIMEIRGNKNSSPVLFENKVRTSHTSFLSGDKKNKFGVIFKEMLRVLN